MKPETSETKQEAGQSQPIDDALQVRIRIIMMKRRFRFLDQRYLSKKLKRSEMAISYALSGKRNQLLARIVTHLDYLERKEIEKKAA